MKYILSTTCIYEFKFTIFMTSIFDKAKNWVLLKNLDKICMQIQNISLKFLKEVNKNNYKIFPTFYCHIKI